MKASLGSVEYISSLFKSGDESKKIKEAVNSSSYRGDFIRAALSVNNKKVIFFLFCNLNAEENVEVCGMTSI